MNEFTPFLISWNLTKRCNLKCDHCYLDASELEGDGGDIPTEEAFSILDKIAEYSPGAMLILTGGEPLLRRDFYDIAQHATEGGLSVVLGTNGTLIDDAAAKRLKACGVQGVGLSLDSILPSSHDEFRGLRGAWEKTVKAIDTLKNNNLEFQIQFTVTKRNYDEIPDLIKLAFDKGAKAANVFFLVCTGRGQEMTDISPEQYEKMLNYLADAETEYSGRMMVRARCAPHFLRVVQQRSPDSQVMKGATSGCIAGTGYFRITPEGEVTPCPYMPGAVGNIRKQSLSEIWESSDTFQSLRNPQYNGKCADCRYNEACGGCRARALSSSGDMLGEDPWCDYKPELDERAALKEMGPVIWEDAATKRLSKVPVFLRGMVKKGLERYAKEKGLRTITPEIMEEMRSRVGGKR
ncbi:MAG: radical SAM protein [Proteobacteria bacterium]|nr:radical SAM protein [Pseudomonadota bacterium]